MGTLRSALQIAVALMLLGLGIWQLYRIFVSSGGIEIGARAPEAVPASLVHKIPGRTGLYWFGLRVRNDSDQPVRGTLSLEAKPSFGSEIDASERLLTLPPGDTTIAVPVSFVDMPPSNRFHWEWDFVQDDDEGRELTLRDAHDQDHPKRHTNPIEIINSTILPFDITTLHGTRVPTDVILAMLSTWTRLADFRGPTVRRAHSLVSELNEEGISGSSRRTEFMRRSVRDLFESGRLSVGAVANPFPMSGRRNIARPDSVLRSAPGSVSPVEAALLLAALAREHDRVTDVRLFVLPATADADAAVALAWHVQGQTWDAIIVEDLSAVEFDKNLVQAKGRVDRLLQDRPEIQAALTENGIFVSETSPVPLVVMDLRQIEAHYDIQPPSRRLSAAQGDRGLQVAADPESR